MPDDQIGDRPHAGGVGVDGAGRPGSGTPNLDGFTVHGSADHAWWSRLASAADTSSQPVAAAASAVSRSSVVGDVPAEGGVDVRQRRGGLPAGGSSVR